MSGEAELYREYVNAMRSPDSIKRPRSTPPTLDPLLHNALNEIQLLKLGYTRSKDIDSMSYFMVRVRQIAAGIDGTLNRSVM